MFAWTHQDVRGLTAAGSQAAARSAIGAWGIDAISQSDGTRVDDFLALVAESLIIRQALIDAQAPSSITELIPSAGKISFNVVQGTASDVDHANAQFILLRTWEVFARSEGWRDSSSSQLSATTGRGGSSAGANAIAIIAVVVGIVALAGLIAFVVWNVNTLIDRQLARKAQAQELMRAHAECQEMLKRHAAAELQAGHPIPFTHAELLIMAKLGQLQDAAMQGFKQTLSGTLPGLWKQGPDDKSPTQVAENILTLAVVLGFVYFLIRREI